MRSSPLSPRLLAPLGILGALALPPDASARPVTANDFQITYEFTNGEGKSNGDRLVQNDLLYYVNQARCECGEQFAARVNLQRSMGEAYDDQPIRTYVGTGCDVGQDSVGGMLLPCALMFNGQPTEYDDGGVDVVFDLVWLSSPVPNINDQSPNSASPVDPCGANQSGNAGIWICAEDGMRTNCQSTEFIITGTQNQNGNSNADPTMPIDPSQGGGGGLTFDYLPPQAIVTGFTSSPGDGAVLVQWDRSESTQIAGFRVLCADLDGNPVPGKGTSAPSLRTNGQLYYTAENLCPGQQVYFGSDLVEDIPIPEADTGTGDSGGETTTGEGLDDPLLGNGWAMDMHTGTSGSGTMGTDGSGSTGDSGTTGTGGSGSDDRGTTTTGDTGGASSLDTPLTSLDWDYVCSEHIGGTGTSTRIGGLENGKSYQFIVVAYDRAGNPLIVSDAVMVETPEETTDFWEQCEIQSNLCDSAGFCRCRAGDPSGAAWLASGLLLLVMAGLRRGRLR